MCTYAASSGTPKIQVCACHVKEEGWMPSKGSRIQLEGRNGYQFAVRHLSLEDAEALLVLAAEPPCDFVLKCHEIRDRNSTDFPGRGVSCRTSSG